MNNIVIKANGLYQISKKFYRFQQITKQGKVNYYYYYYYYYCYFVVAVVLLTAIYNPMFCQ